MFSCELQPWFFQLKPLEGESISHFLGRFRRANELTVTGLSTATGLGSAIGRWEKFRFNPRPSIKELEALASVVGIKVDDLLKMLPPEGTEMKMEPIRLCGACYAKSPCHQIQWQFKTSDRCLEHQLTLLSECPNCKARFKSPALWIEGHCHRCFITFAQMKQHQKYLG